MSSYKNYFLIISIIFLFLGCTTKYQPSADTKIFDEEDELIVFALEFEKMKSYNKSVDIYMELFTKTNRYLYLTRALKLNLEQKNYKKVIELARNNINESSNEYENIIRIYIRALNKLKKYDLALKNSNELLSKYNNSKNYEIIGDIHYLKKNYDKAVGYYESAYASDYKPRTLLNLVNILYSFLNEKEKALSYLETHVRLYGDELVVNYKLLSIYQEQKDIDGIISILKRIYYKYKRDENKVPMAKTSEILVSYLEKKDIYLAIKFLNKENTNLEKLLSLYKQTNQIKKALDVIMTIYKKSGNIDLLAQVAVLEFENAKDKKEVLSSVIKKFKEVLTVLDNHIYQNYLGYILIDFDIDIKKGLEYVNMALKKAPNNIAYIDSLAWGQYKLNNCRDAYINMKKVVDEVGLEDKEIKLHWKKIKECQK